MARFAPGLVDEILEKTDLVSLISDHVPTLKGTGDRFKGLCPFHDEKTPSFTVSPSKGLFYCFGCRKGGNAITFVQEMESLAPAEAVKYLAQRAGVTLRYVEGSSPEEDHERRGLLEQVAGYYHHCLLKSPLGKQAREYLRQRGVSEEIQVRFRLGYAPAAWDDLCKQLHRWQVSFPDAEKAGLILLGAKSGNHYGRFRDRIIFPITDALGHVVGFGGRALSAQDDAKYLNSPETELFKKGQILYGLYQAREAIKKEKQVIVSEGYMDVIALHQFGFENAVAVLGTAMTNDHVRRLKRYTDQILLVFDADRAGQSAAVRSTETLSQNDLRGRVLCLPRGEDPDSFLRQQGQDAWTKLVTNEALVPFDFMMKQARERNPGPSIESKSAVGRELLQFIAGLPRAMDRSLHLGLLAAQLGIPQESLARDLNALRGKREGVVKPLGQGMKSHASTAADAAKRGLVVLVLNSDSASRIGGERIRALSSLIDDTEQPETVVDQVFAALVRYVNESDRWEVGSFVEFLGDEQIKSALMEIVLSEPPASKPEKQWQDCCDTLQRLQVEQEIQRQIQEFQNNPSVDYLREGQQQYQHSIQQHEMLWRSISETEPGDRGSSAQSQVRKQRAASSAVEKHQDSEEQT